MSSLQSSPAPHDADITALLLAWPGGDKEVEARLLRAVYAELRRGAARAMRRESPEHTLQPTALVHETYLRLIDQRRVEWRNRAHFFGVAAQLMRRITFAATAKKCVRSFQSTLRWSTSRR